MAKNAYNLDCFVKSPNDHNYIMLVNSALSSDEADQLAEAIKNSDTIQSVNFSGGSISESVAEKLFSAIIANWNIKVLAISNMSLNDCLINKLIDTLEGNTTLQTLALNSADIGDINAIKIISAVRKTSIKNLGLKFNQISYSTKGELLNIFTNNENFDLNLDGNDYIGSMGADSGYSDFDL